MNDNQIEIAVRAVEIQEEDEVKAQQKNMRRERKERIKEKAGILFDN